MPQTCDGVDTSLGSGTSSNGSQWKIFVHIEETTTYFDIPMDVTATAHGEVKVRAATDPPPDGGWRAWLCVLCGHFIFMNTWGFINSFGIFQTYYTSVLDLPAADVSWIGSIQVFLSFFIGAVVGRYTDAGYLRLMLVCGATLILVGIFTASCATQYWQLVLSQGICCGLGNGFLVTPAVAVVSTYFERKRSLVIGLTTCGSVTGGLIFPAMARQLIPTIGFAWTLRAIGFVQLATLAVIMAFMKSRLPPQSPYHLVDWASFKEREYTFFTVGMFFNFWAVFFGYFFLGSFSRDVIGLTYVESLNLLLVLNGVGIIGRTLPNYLADKVGPLGMLIPACLLASVMVFSWIAVHTLSQLYAWTVLYGIIGGSILSLFPAGISSLTTDLSTRGARIGMNFTVISFAVLTGNPIASAIIAAQHGAYIGAQVFMGISLLVGMVFIYFAQIIKEKSA
ncbi:hypothetical protein PFICI_09218 [Pestalotiopsis fici W106-1]|uniref:Major facilitator superfamily (MFS) profile domain-containing protein n=1 Tax=Pestalotiopsis fici (strain W106-1 / CGMCC3.15140) TaxID=1229662 RepID=W3WZU3_PESFW|nr:uncharacterized protein PFICI_09218 [Pestalotiopsis fici W106-1]ETS79365.1 hypothetical protein PFICI_09218 [Pestalotiopsis fici W106-1]